MDSHPVLSNYRQAFQACQTRAAASLNGLTRQFNEAQTLIDELNQREKKINDREKELESSKTHLDSLKSLIKKNLNDLDSVTESLKQKRDESEATERRFTDSTAKLWSVEMSLGSKSKELREVEAAVKGRREEARVKEKQIGEREKELVSVTERVRRKTEEADSTEKRITDAAAKLRSVEKSLESKERRFKELKRSIEECEKEIKSKKEKLNLTQKCMVECSNTLESRKVMVREIEMRVRDFNKKLEAWCFKLESKERREEKIKGGEDEEFAVVVKRVERNLERLDEHKRECELREERVRELEAKAQVEMESSNNRLLFMTSLISTKSEELDVIEKSLVSVEDCVEEKRREVEAKEKEVKRVDEKLGSYGEEIEVKKRQLDEVLGLVEAHKRDLDLKEEEVKNKRRCIEECEREMELKRKDFDDIEKKVERYSEIVHEHKRECELIEERVMEVERSVEEREAKAKVEMELKRKELEASKLVEEQAKEAEKKLFYIGKCVEQKKSEFECKEMELKTVQKQIEVKGRELGEILKSIQEYTKESELKGMHVKTLEETIKEREMSLDAISNKLNEREEQMQFDSQMPTVQLENEMREEQMQFDSQMETVELDNEKSFASLEIEERGKILAALSQLLQDPKDDSEWPLEEQMVIVPPFALDEININADGTSSMSEQSIRLEPVERIMSALLNADETLQLIGMISQNKKLTLQSFQRLGFEDKIPNIVRVLIEKNLVVEAARLICTFNLHGQFAPVQLLKSFVDDAKRCCFEVFDKVNSDNEQEKVVHNQMDDMIAAAQCVEDHDLESEYSSIDIRLEMREVAKLLDDKQKKSQGRKQGGFSSVTDTPHTHLLRQRRNH